MKLNFTFKHLDHSDALEAYTQERLQEISRFLLKDGHGKVCYGKTRDVFNVEVSINTREKYFKAVSHNYDVYLAVDEVVAKLEKQFLKLRKLVKDHKNFDQSKEGRLSQLDDNFESPMTYRKAA